MLFPNITNTAALFSILSPFNTNGAIVPLVAVAACLAFALAIVGRKLVRKAKSSSPQGEDGELPFASETPAQCWGLLAQIGADCAIAAQRFVRNLHWVEAPNPVLIPDEEEDPEYSEFFHETHRLISDIVQEHQIINYATTDGDVERKFFQRP